MFINIKCHEKIDVFSYMFREKQRQTVRLYYVAVYYYSETF